MRSWHGPLQDWNGLRDTLRRVGNDGKIRTPASFKTTPPIPGKNVPEFSQDLIGLMEKPDKTPEESERESREFLKQSLKFGDDQLKQAVGEYQFPNLVVPPPSAPPKRTESEKENGSEVLEKTMKGLVNPL